MVLVVAVTTLLNKEAPFTFLQLLWVNLLMDTYAAIALAWQAPRENNARLKFEINKAQLMVTPEMTINIVLQTLLCAAIQL